MFLDVEGVGALEQLQNKVHFFRQPIVSLEESLEDEQVEESKSESFNFTVLTRLDCSRSRLDGGLMDQEWVMHPFL